MTSYTVLNLVLNDDYSFWVTALNPLESIPSDILTLKAAQLPDAPTSISIVAGTRTGSSFELEWPAVINDGGSPILSYTLV